MDLLKEAIYAISCVLNVVTKDMVALDQVIKQNESVHNAQYN